MINKIFNIIKYAIIFILRHPIWVTTIICVILCFLDGKDKGEWNFAGYAFLEFVILALISPYIRKLRRDKANKEGMDYLAKKIAEEIKNS